MAARTAWAASCEGCSGRPWSYQIPPAGSAVGADKDYVDRTFSDAMPGWWAGRCTT
jgi:hypothetical protein